MNKFLLIFSWIFMENSIFAQNDFLKKLMESQPEHFQNILHNQQKYEVQILYTQINRNSKNEPNFKIYSYQVNHKNYFYPASTVKLPACLLALEKLNNLNVNGLDKDSFMITGVDFDGQTHALTDSTSASGYNSIAHYIKKILIVSDNDAFNRLYEFIGQKDFNESLWKKGYTKTRILHRLQTSITSEQNRHTNPVQFKNDGILTYSQHGEYNTRDFYPKKAIKKGNGYIGNDEKLVNEGFDFTKKNKFALEDQHLMLKAILFPTAVKIKNRFNLKDSDYNFLYKYMSQLPTESLFPKYPPREYWPTYCKFVLFGSEKDTHWPTNIRVFNKVGDAYGFLLDNAYVVDYELGIEFLVSAVILCNEDQIFNDDKYDYDSIGFPFMKNLGKLLYNYEKNRLKKYLPNLEKMKFVYDK